MVDHLDPGELNTESGANSASAGGRPNRVRWLISWCLVTAVVAAGAFVAGRFVRSPWDDAVANAAADLKTTARVSERDFVAEVVRAEGIASLGRQVSIPVPVTAASRAVVTSVGAKAGERVADGMPIASVSGRPVFLLGLQIPLYRDLQPGMYGPDVESIQHALAHLGLYRGLVDGEYGAGTADAVEALYARARQEPPKDVPFVDWEPPSPEPQELESSSASSDAANPPKKDAPTGESKPPEGTPLPMAEIADMPTGGATVVSIPKMGDDMSEAGELAILRTGRPEVTSRVSVSEGDAFRPGETVVLAVPGVASVEVRVESVSDFLPGGDSGSQPGYDVVVQVPGTLAGKLSEGASATIATVATAVGERALAVPLTAVREDSLGKFVLLERKEPVRIEVHLGLESDGYAQLVKADGIEVGDVVLIGGSGG